MECMSQVCPAYIQYSCGLGHFNSDFFNTSLSMLTNRIWTTVEIGYQQKHLQDQSDKAQKNNWELIRWKLPQRACWPQTWANRPLFKNSCWFVAWMTFYRALPLLTAPLLLLFFTKVKKYHKSLSWCHKWIHQESFAIIINQGQPSGIQKTYSHCMGQGQHQASLLEKSTTVRPFWDKVQEECVYGVIFVRLVMFARYQNL